MNINQIKTYLLHGIISMRYSHLQGLGDDELDKEIKRLPAEDAAQLEISAHAFCNRNLLISPTAPIPPAPRKEQERKAKSMTNIFRRGVDETQLSEKELEVRRAYFEELDAAGDDCTSCNRSKIMQKYIKKLIES